MTIENTKQQFTSATAPYSLKSLLETYKTDTAVTINCHHIGTIQTFDSATQTATASINYTKTYFEYDQKTNSNKPIQINYPLLMMCPVICLGGGSTALTFPIESGDECLILFNDRSIDNWFQSGQIGPINSPRVHSISDGLILVGLRNSQSVLEDYNTTHAVIRNDAGAQVGVNSATAKVLVGNNSTTLNAQLQSLITAIQAITVTVDGSPTPINNIASFTPIASALGGLLE